MSGPALLVFSSFAGAAEAFEAAIAAGRLRAVREDHLTEAMIDDAPGLVTTMHLDQIGFERRSRAIGRLLARGGRFFFNGHLLMPFMPELAPYRPIEQPRVADLELSAASPHPIFAGIDVPGLTRRRGVAGFYGRGHVPPPEGATIVTTMGPACVPVDWEWKPASGGRLFVHAGNDLWQTAEDAATNLLLAERIAIWAAS